LDKKALPAQVYDHIIEKKLPLYEWNMIEVATRSRFTAYSHNLDSTFGFTFIMMVLLWLRGHNVRGKTPLEKLRGYKTLIHPHIYSFPVLLMMDVIKVFGPAIG
jgi:hypothetical protein